MSIVQKLRRFVGAGANAGILKPLLEDGVWPRGGVNRYVSHGIPKDVLEAFRLNIKSIADWEREFGNAARRYRGMGDKQEVKGYPALASRYRLVAAACAFHAQLVPLDSQRSVAEWRHHCRAAFRAAADSLQPGLTLVTFTFAGGESPGYYRRTTLTPHGTVVLLNSQQSCKEDMFYFTQPMVDMGLNAVLIDTPGTGEAVPEMPYAGVDDILAALDDQIPRLPGAGGVPTLLLGAGVGGAVALHMLAAAPGRFQAAALLSPPYDLQLEHEHLRPWVAAELCAFLGCTTSALPEVLGRVRCAGLASRVTAPVLIVGAGKDRDFPHKQSKQLAKEFGRKRAAYWGFGHATHCAHEKQPQLRARIAQWLGKRVGCEPPRLEYVDDFTDE